MKHSLLPVFLLLPFFNSIYAMEIPPNNADKIFATLQCMEGIINDQLWLVHASIAQGINPTFEKPEAPYRYHNVLQIACSKRNHAAVESILDSKGLDIHTYNAIKGTSSTIKLALRGKDYPIFASLLKHPSADINKTDFGGNSLWHRVSDLGNVEFIKALLAYENRDKNIRDKEENTPLIMGINMQNYEGETPLHMVCEEDNHNAMQLLVENGANTTIRNHRRMTPLVMSYVKKEGLFRFNAQTGQPTIIYQMIQDKDADGNTQLHLATEITTLDYDVLEKYLHDITVHSSNNVVCIGARNNHGQTAIDLAYDHYYKKHQEYLNERIPGRKKLLAAQEKSLHTFLQITAPTMDIPCALFTQALAFEAHETSLPWEIKQLIARKYCELNVEKIIAKKDIYQNEYYSDYIENKNRLKKDLCKDPKALQLLWK